MSRAFVFREIRKCAGDLRCPYPVHVNVKGFAPREGYYYCATHGGPKRGYLEGSHRHPAWTRFYPPERPE